MPCMKNEPSPAITTVRPPVSARTAERHADAGAEAVPHAAHAERDDEPAAAPHRQVVDRRRADVARVDDDVDPSGSIRSSTVIASRYRIPGPSCAGGRSSTAAPRPVRATRAGRPWPDSAAVSSRQRPRRSSVCTWVHGRYGGADPIEYTRRRAQRVVQTRRAPSPTSGCRPAGTAHSRRRRRRHRDAPSRRSRRARMTIPSRECPRRPWRRARMRDPGAQQRPQLLEFGAGIVTGDLLAGDDRDRPVGAPQCACDRLRIAGLHGRLDPGGRDAAVDRQSAC